MGKAFPYPQTRVESLAQRSAVSRSVGHIRAPTSSPLWVYRFRYGPTPRPRPAFALGSHLRGFSF